MCQSIGLHGRYHHPAHSQAVEALKALCKRDKRFQYPDAKCLALPLRSDSTSALIVQGHLHDIALSSILAEQSQWWRTVTAVLTSAANKKLEIHSVGTESFLPRSVSTKSQSQSVRDKAPNGVARGRSTPSQSSLDSELPQQGGQYKIDESVPRSAIAVVGMACRFPEADSIEEFWELIVSGSCAVQQVPKDRFDTLDLRRDPKGPFFGNFIRDPDAFDHRFFGISGREAKSMDPQQRLLLEVAYEAIESSGYLGLRTGGQQNDVGCYIGVGAVDYGDNVASHSATAFSASGTLRAFISGKVSHHFGWTGPSITYDTACSSSAVAIHSACKVSMKRSQAISYIISGRKNHVELVRARLER